MSGEFQMDLQFKLAKLLYNEIPKSPSFLFQIGKYQMPFKNSYFRLDFKACAVHITLAKSDGKLRLLILDVNCHFHN